MRKYVAIVLLAVHLFYAGGYVILFQYLINQSNQFIENQISKGLYNPKDLIELKLPVHLPNVQSWSDYLPVSGQLQLKDESYNYVKLKVTQDTLYIKYVPNYRTTRLINANIICAKNVSDLPSGKRDTTSSFKKINFDVISLERLRLSERRPRPDGHQYKIYDMAYMKNPALDTPFMPPDLSC
jgi:hypothetical protein